ncbi:MAG: nucleoside-diphosphate kinase [candidate division WOR-3 bacterium]
MKERSLLVIKPDAVKKKKIGKIIEILEENGFEIKDIKMKRLKKEEAEKFYMPHKGKDFFNKLIDFITSGEVVGILVEKENAIEKLRELVGETDPKKARCGTIRHMFGENITENAVHAADSLESFKREISIFF